MNENSCELPRRSVVKAIVYRVVSMAVDSGVAYFFTRSIPLSISIVVFVNAYSTIIYYFHERFWAHIEWGRCPAPSSTISRVR